MRNYSENTTPCDTIAAHPGAAEQHRSDSPRPFEQYTTPDSLSGVIFALEGVAGSVVLLNGPT